MLVIIALYLILKKMGMSSDKLEIWDSPLEVAGEPIGKSTVEARVHSSLHALAPEVSFETEDVKTMPLGIPEEARLESTLISLGDPRTTKPSTVYWKGGKFELHIWFFVHNQSLEAIRLKDVKAHVYHVSMYQLRPAMIVWAPKVELAMDNTADLSSIPDPLAPGEDQPVHLVFETSVFDTLFTTLVFGLSVNYSKGDPSSLVLRIPSDRIFIFQHDHRWGAERSHFVSRSEDEIDEVQAQTGSHKEFFDSLRLILKTHRGRKEQILGGRGLEQK